MSPLTCHHRVTICACLLTHAHELHNLLRKASHNNTVSHWLACPPAGFQLAEKECRRLQDPELTKCKAGCNKKDCVAIGKKCDDSFDKGTMLAAWCRQKEGC